MGEHRIVKNYFYGIASIDNVMTLIKMLLGNPKTFRGEMYIL